MKIFSEDGIQRLNNEMLVNKQRMMCLKVLAEQLLDSIEHRKTVYTNWKNNPDSLDVLYDWAHCESGFTAHCIEFINRLSDSAENSHSLSMRLYSGISNTHSEGIDDETRKIR